MNETERPGDAVMVTLRDGKEREVLFTLLSVRRIERLPKTSDDYSETDRVIDSMAEAFRLTDPDLSRNPEALADLVDMKSMKAIQGAIKDAMGKAQDAAVEVSGESPK